MLRGLGVVAGGGLVALLTGCSEDALLGGLGNNFDFRLLPSTFAIVRGDTGPRTIQVDVVLVDVRNGSENLCTFQADDPGARLVVSRAGGSGTGPGAFSFRSSGCASFAIDVRSPVDVAVGSHRWELRGEWSRELVAEESLTRTLVVEVTSEIAVEITAPADGAILAAGPVALNAAASTVFGGLTTLEIIVAGGAPDTVWSASGGGETSVSLSETVDLPVGTPTIVVRATNDLGNSWTDEVSVTAVGSAVVTWDGEAGDGLWTTPANWDGDAVPGAGALVVIGETSDSVTLVSPGVVDVRGLSLAGRLAITEGELNVAEAVTVEGELALEYSLTGGNRPSLGLGDALALEGLLTCVQGTIRGGAVNVAAGATLRTDICGWEDLSIENAGEVLVHERATAFLGAATLHNAVGATLRLEGGGLSCDDPCAGSIDNDGTVVVTGFRVQVDPSVTNAGTIDHATAALDLAAGDNTGTITSARGPLTFRGNWTTSSTSSITAGTLYVYSPLGTSLYGALDVTALIAGAGTTLTVSSSQVAGRPRVEVTDATLYVGGGTTLEIGILTLGQGTIEVGAGSELAVLQALDWYEGTLRGGGRTVVSQRLLSDPEAGLTMRGLGPMRLDGHRLRVLGRTDWYDGDVLAGNGATFEISDAGFSDGVMYVYADVTFDGDALGGTAASFANASVLRKVGGDGTTTIRACYEEAPGAQVVAETGTFTFVDLCPPGGVGVRERPAP